MSITKSVTRSRFTWSVMAVFGSIALLVAPQMSFADNAAPASPASPATPASPAAPTAPAPAAHKPVPAKKKAMHKKHPVRHAAKAGYKGLSIMGKVVATDLSASPETIVVSKSLGKKGTLVFGGDLTSHTVILKGRKHVKASAIKEGEKVTVHYKKAMGSLIVTKICIR
ncbi:MAG: hypothetical protein ACYCTV_09515 [Leptospirales bacterium]